MSAAENAPLGGPHGCHDPDQTRLLVLLLGIFPCCVRMPICRIPGVRLFALAFVCISANPVSGLIVLVKYTAKDEKENVWGKRGGVGYKYRLKYPDTRTNANDGEEMDSCWLEYGCAITFQLSQKERGKGLERDKWHP